MAYFLRFTNDAEADIERGVSYHHSGVSVDDSTVEDVACIFDCDENEIVELDNGLFNFGTESGEMFFFQELKGLCGFELDSEDLEEAIEEALNLNFSDVYNTVGMMDAGVPAIIFSGEWVDHCPEGVCFEPEKVVHVIKK